MRRTRDQFLEGLRREFESRKEIPLLLVLMGSGVSSYLFLGSDSGISIKIIGWSFSRGEIPVVVKESLIVESRQKNKEAAWIACLYYAWVRRRWTILGRRAGCEIRKHQVEPRKRKQVHGK